MYTFSELVLHSSFLASFYDCVCTCLLSLILSLYSSNHAIWESLLNASTELVYLWFYNCFSWLMSGPAEWPFMSCWLEHIPLRIKMTLEILGKQFRYAIFPPLQYWCSHCFILLSHHLIPVSFPLRQRIMAVQYKIPDYVHISQDCKHLLSRIFVANPLRVCYHVCGIYMIFLLLQFDGVISNLL